MPQQIGASSGATDLSNGVGSSLQSVADDVRATMKALADLDAEHRAAHQAAAARAMASCGVRCEDAVWVTECAWCNRMRSVAGDWQTLAPAVRAAMKIERTHGVCPQCAQGLMARAEGADREAR